MIIQLNWKRFLGRALLCAIYTGLCLRAYGADPVDLSDPSGIRFDLKFPGGTAEELAAAIEKAADAVSTVKLVVNLLVPNKEEVIIPQLDLRSVTARSVFEALTILSEDSQWRQAGGAKGNIWTLQKRPEDRRTQVFYVGKLLDQFKIDDITTAIQTTWEMDPHTTKRVKPELKFHQDTQLLIAVAGPEQIGTIQEVLSQLKQSLNVP